MAAESPIAQAARLLRLWAGDRMRSNGVWSTQEQAGIDCALGLEAVTDALSDLTALVQEWQAAHADLTARVDAEELPDHDQAAENALYAAARRDEAAMRNVLAWSPAPAPVAPPTGDTRFACEQGDCRDGEARSAVVAELRAIAAWINQPGHVWREDAIDECRRVLTNRARALEHEGAPLQPFAAPPVTAEAAPPVAKGDAMPEIQVGDRVKLAGFGWRVVPDAHTARLLGGNDGVDVVERDGVDIWRRQEKP